MDWASPSVIEGGVPRVDVGVEIGCSVSVGCDVDWCGVAVEEGGRGGDGLTSVGATVSVGSFTGVGVITSKVAPVQADKSKLSRAIEQ